MGSCFPHSYNNRNRVIPARLDLPDYEQGRVNS
jgi:hypothetical protein